MEFLRASNDTSATQSYGYAPTTQTSKLSKCFVDDLVIVKVARFMVYSVILLTSLVANSMTVFLIWKKKRMRKTVNYFIVNMAVSDLLITTVYMPRQMIKFFIGSQWIVGGAFGAVLCKAFTCHCRISIDSNPTGHKYGPILRGCISHENYVQRDASEDDCHLNMAVVNSSSRSVLLCPRNQRAVLHCTSWHGHWGRSKKHILHVSSNRLLYHTPSCSNHFVLHHNSVSEAPQVTRKRNYSSSSRQDQTKSNKENSENGLLYHSCFRPLLDTLLCFPNSLPNYSLWITLLADFSGSQQHCSQSIALRSL